MQGDQHAFEEFAEVVINQQEIQRREMIADVVEMLEERGGRKPVTRPG
ncbi:hypothetical protein [Leisingera sp. ANG-M1]|nr:hypothetical protein [Leisingera sp. ANG-M1]